MRARRLIPLALVAGVATIVAAAAGLAGSGSGDAATKTYKVGLVSDVGRFNDRSFNQSALEGLRRAQRTLGIQGRAVESRQTSDYIPNLSSLARQRYDVTISVGFLLAEATNTVATRFRNSKFAIIDYSVKAPPFKSNRNVQGLTFATNENSYMIGCLAALMANRAGAKNISAVGGIKLPTVDIFIAGYRAGARRCVPGTTVQIGYSQDFVAQDKCKEIALNQIAQGSKVVFQVAGGCGLGALDAAKERRVWGVGVDRDQRFLGRHILTSAVKRVDQSVYLTAKAVKEGKFRGGTDAVFNLKNNGVAIGRTDSRVPRAFTRRMNALRPLIISGRIKPPKKL
ncbi:MAG TPA: BMP family ABC transporter substrate-binding protein [Gaiellaceae bacterium]|nr:BMP family ABC transporter substrate-binding protein [Gaiellaceae bacterium]